MKYNKNGISSIKYTFGRVCNPNAWARNYISIAIA